MIGRHARVRADVAGQRRRHGRQIHGVPIGYPAVRWWALGGGQMADPGGGPGDLTVGGIDVGLRHRVLGGGAVVGVGCESP